MKIGLTYDLKEDYLKEGYSVEETAELDTPETVNRIESAINKLGYETERIGNIRSLVGRLNDNARWDMVFNICEGINGTYSRESQVPALLEAYNIAYTFSDPIVLGISLKKDLAKTIVRANGFKTPDFFVIKGPEDVEKIDLPYPLFVKPLAEGSSKGVADKSKVGNKNQLKSASLELLKKFKQPVLVETYCSGREFTAGLIGTGIKAECIGGVEVVLTEKAEKNAYSYKNKTMCEEAVEYKPITDKKLDEEIKKFAVDAWRTLECRDAGRIDIMLDKNGDINFIEVNPLAGLNPNYSDLPIMFSMLGRSYEELIELIVNSALDRVEKR
ncbi:MAG TPA: ATP-grasp domain-containing protein [Spirochaetota bacterium]|jgi:D-alanine-D-alanine ligase|nr:MAG: D-alanine--D-alanine ligase [Spirochaetes bacterium ADurb.Bin133]HNZ25676.1 ATP-grasp domain-containing protein [Spirochaetota bacterium]HPY88104.1 ATP-grasp domain-containing protein [Spirochaetota bacterium]